MNAAPESESVGIDEYRRAEELWPTELIRRAKNVAIVPTWLGLSDIFWFIEECATGHSYVLVDASTGRRRDAFDHGTLATLLNADSTALPIATLEYNLGIEEEALRLEVIDTSSLTLTLTGSPQILRVDLETGTVDELAQANTRDFLARDGSIASVRDFNIWLTQPEKTERALTHDGEEFMAWALTGDDDHNRIPRHWNDLERGAAGLFWSPDSQRMLVQRVDQRTVDPYHYLQYVRPDGDTRPQHLETRNRLPGQSGRTHWDWFIIDAATGHKVSVEPLDHDLVINPNMAWWRESGELVYVIARTSAMTRMALVEITADTGATRVLHEERGNMLELNSQSSHANNVHYLPHRESFLWFSQSTGWGHLYEIDLREGGVRRAITAGEWPVFDLIRVTDEHVFFTAGGRELGARSPYYRHLYRVDLAGDEPNRTLTHLTPEIDADHAFPGYSAFERRSTPTSEPTFTRTQMAPSGRYFVDSVSRVDLAPVINIRDASGNFVTELARADISELLEIDYQLPETFTAKAADGETDIYGIIIRPRRFHERESWPVVERVYGGPQTLVQSRSFLEGMNGSFIFGMHAFADLGFVVVALDGPGTPCRSLAFRDLTWGQADRLGMKHHRAAIEGAASSRPWMNISRVGIHGHSYGGYATTMALLLEPDFYHAGYCTAGVFDLMGATAVIADAHFGDTDYGNGRNTMDFAGEVPHYYRETAASTYVENLRGHLGLLFSEADEGVEPSTTPQFVDALVRAGKSFDLVYLPGRSHNTTNEPYHQKKIWDFFLKYVHKRAPQEHLKLSVPAGERLYFT